MIGPDDWRDRFGRSSTRVELDQIKETMEECLNALAVIATRVEEVSRAGRARDLERAKLGGDLVELDDRLGYLVRAMRRLQMERGERPSDEASDGPERRS